MKKTGDILNTLQDMLMELNEFGVKRIGLFGSYARGEQSDKSDIDILINFHEGQKTYENLFHVHELLIDRFGNNVELVTVGGLSPYIGPHVLKEVIYVDQAAT